MSISPTRAPAPEVVLSLLAGGNSGSPAATAAACAGAMAAELIAQLCYEQLDHAAAGKPEDDLRAIRARALSLRRDLLAVVERLDDAARAVAEAQRPTRLPAQMADERLRALLFAAEVPLRAAESCHALLNLSLLTLGKVGVRGIGEIGTATALAFAGVVGGVVTARAYLSGIASGRGMGVGVTRKRAERIFREGEAVRTQITDRVRQHLP
jgi:formiminotetrahydrofolate cyclodeaminase